MHLYRSPSRELYEQHLESVMEYAVQKYIKAVSADMKIADDNKKIIIQYYKCLLVGFVLDWMNSGMKYDIRDIMKKVCALFSGSMQNALERAGTSR